MNEQVVTGEKLKFADIWKQAGLDFLKMAETVAELAEVQISVVENLMLSIPVAKTDARQVLNTISQLTRLRYELDSLDIPTVDESLINQWGGEETNGMHNQVF